jgi:predicted alpha/beta-fold hydrolase
MQPFVVGQELQFRQEATKRTLLDLFEAGDHEGLLNAAMLLNSLWHQQTAIARWFAKEAADNLGEAWQASRSK